MRRYKWFSILWFVILILIPFGNFVEASEESEISQFIIPQEDDPTGDPIPEVQVFTGTDPGNGGGGTIESLSGSFVVFDPTAGGDDFYLPGETQTFCFRSETYTPDWEYVYDNWLRFPTTWTVSDVYLQGTPTCDSGATWGSFSWSFHTSPYEVDIYHPRHQAPTDHCVATYCVEVTSIASSDPVPVSWYFDGDSYGSTPHWPCSSDGYTPSGESACDQAWNPPARVPIHTNWEQIATDPLPKMDNVLAAYHGKVWNITGYAGVGGDDRVSYYVPATNSWAIVSASEPPFGNTYARSGCQMGNKVYMFGDTSTPGFTGLWSYNLATKTWTAETPSGTPPPHTGIWAPAWVADPETNRCYLTGGATVNGGGDLNSVYVYDAGTNQWLAPLPQFNTVRDFHAAFLFRQPTNGHKLLCVAGGIDDSYNVWDSTQCYDFNTANWHVENADLGVLPVGWWGMGYTQRSTATGDQLWMVNGADDTVAMYDQTWFYDVTTNSWVNMSHLESGAFFRTSAVTLNDTVYHVGGSSLVGFSPSGISDGNSPVLTIDPFELDVTLKINGSPQNEMISISNDRDIPYSFTITEKDEGYHPLINIPAFTDALPEDTRPVSSGLAPGGQAVTSTEPGLLSHLHSMDPAYAVKIFPAPEELVYIPDTANPGNWNSISASLFTFPSGGDFINNDSSTLYAVKYNAAELYRIDTSTGSATLVGTATPPSGHQWTGLSGTADGTLYGLSSQCGTATHLVTINPATATVTDLGGLTGITCGIDLAYNTSENLIYIVDIVTDHLFRVDPSTLAVTDIGSLGVNANYAQSMDYDDASGILYWAAYASSQGELRVIDMKTGASALVGAFPGGADVDCLAFKTDVAWDVPWLSEDLVTDTIPVGGSQDVQVTFDPTGLTEGDYLATLRVNNWPFPEIDLPVTLHIELYKQYMPLIMK